MTGNFCVQLLMSWRNSPIHPRLSLIPETAVDGNIYWSIEVVCRDSRWWSKWSANGPSEGSQTIKYTLSEHQRPSSGNCVRPWAWGLCQIWQSLAKGDSSDSSRSPLSCIGRVWIWLPRACNVHNRLNKFFPFGRKSTFSGCADIKGWSLLSAPHWSSWPSSRVSS